LISAAREHRALQQGMPGKQGMLDVSWTSLFTEEFITDGLQQPEALLLKMKSWQCWLPRLKKPLHL